MKRDTIKRLSLSVITSKKIIGNAIYLYVEWWIEIEPVYHLKNVLTPKYKENVLKGNRFWSEPNYFFGRLFSSQIESHEANKSVNKELPYMQ